MQIVESSTSFGIGWYPNNVTIASVTAGCILCSLSFLFLEDNIAGAAFEAYSMRSVCVLPMASLLTVLHEAKRGKGAKRGGG